MEQLIADYQQYYDYRQLVECLTERCLFPLILPLLQEQNLQRIFDFAINYGIRDLVMYLYIHRKCVYDPRTESKVGLKSYIESEPVPDELSLEFGGSLGLHPTFLDKQSNGCLQIFVELYRLRIHSHYHRIGDKWVYQFDQRYTSKHADAAVPK